MGIERVNRTPDDVTVFRSGFSVWVIKREWIWRATRLEKWRARSRYLTLYTSEGCSRCPPARVVWRSGTAKLDEGTEVVAVSVHVDYWDQWEDGARFRGNRSSAPPAALFRKLEKRFRLHPCGLKGQECAGMVSRWRNASKWTTNGDRKIWNR